jgi:hypothetical protein
MISASSSAPYAAYPATEPTVLPFNAMEQHVLLAQGDSSDTIVAACLLSIKTDHRQRYFSQSWRKYMYVT